MSNISVNISELLSIIDITPSEQNIMLVGNHGIGKSEILSEYFSSKGMKVVPLFLGQMSDPGDLIGIPTKNEVTGRTVFMPPYWFPREDEPVVLFLDELNRARPEILQTIMDLALNRKLAGRKLPEGSRIISAVNEGFQYQLTDLDPALVSRFNIFTFRPSVSEWLDWAQKEKVHESVITFITENNSWLDGDPAVKDASDKGLDKTPDRRAWKRVSDVLKICGTEPLSIQKKCVSGIIGPRAASAFFEAIDSRHILKANNVLLHFEKSLPVLREYTLHELAIVSDDIFRTLNLNLSSMDNTGKSKAGSALSSYFDFLQKEHKEAAAHFTQMFIDNKYRKANNFICKNPVMAMSLQLYAQSLR